MLKDFIKVTVLLVLLAVFPITIFSQTMTVKVYFTNLKFDPNMEDCNKVFPVKREIKKTKTVAKAALEELFKGNNILDAPASVYYDTDYDTFEQYCEAFDVKDGDVIAVLTAYFDESYNQPKDSNKGEHLIYAVGCCLSTKEQWTKFNVKWKSALEAEPKIDYFHMCDFEFGAPPYTDWSDSVRKERLQRFHTILKEHTIFNCASVVSRDDFDTVPIKRYKLPNFDYYTFNVIVCMDEIASWCRKNNHNEPIRYFFSHIVKQGAYLDEWFSYCLRHPELKKRYRMFESWSKGLMKDVPPLQAADIIAYEMNKRAANEYGKTKQYFRPELDSLNLPPDRFNALFYGKEELHDILNKNDDIAPFKWMGD
jgi:hypothetical protein